MLTPPSPSTLSSTFVIDSDHEIQTCLGIFSWLMHTTQKNKQAGVSIKRILSLAGTIMK